jgi:hypothetical protein
MKLRVCPMPVIGSQYRLNGVLSFHNVILQFKADKNQTVLDSNSKWKAEIVRQLSLPK